MNEKQFTQEEIEFFITKYKEKLRETTRLSSYYNLANFQKAISKNIQKIISKLEELKETDLYQFNVFKGSETASSTLYNYFNEGLKKFDKLDTSAKKKRCPYDGDAFMVGAGYPLAGSASAIVFIVVLGGLGLMPIGWIAIPAVILIGAIGAMIYMGVVNNKAIKDPHSPYMVQLEKDISEFSQHVDQLESFTNEHIETIKGVVEANVKLENVTQRNPSYDSINFEKQSRTGPATSDSSGPSPLNKSSSNNHNLLS